MLRIIRASFIRPLVEDAALIAATLVGLLLSLDSGNCIAQEAEAADHLRFRNDLNT